MSCSIRQNICKNTVYNDTINCNSNGGIIVRNEINLQDRMLAALRQQSQMIYKHAISTIIPQHPVELYGAREERADS